MLPSGLKYVVTWCEGYLGHRIAYTSSRFVGESERQSLLAGARFLWNNDEIEKEVATWEGHEDILGAGEVLERDP